MFGLYVVCDVLFNFVWEKLCLIVMKNVYDKLVDVIEIVGIVLEMVDLCKFKVLIDL